MIWLRLVEAHIKTLTLGVQTSFDHCYGLCDYANNDSDDDDDDDADDKASTYKWTNQSPVVAPVDACVS